MKTKRKNPVTVSVSTSLTDIAKNNPDRVALMLVNNSVNDIYIDVTSQVSSSVGFTLVPEGIVSFLVKDHGALVTDAWFGIADNNSSDLRVYEIIKVNDEQ